LLYVAPFAPHKPYTTTPRYGLAPVSQWKGNPAVAERDISDKPRFVRQAVVPSARSEYVRAAQLRSLMPVDDLVDRLLRRLRDLGEERRTLAFFMSDGGYLWGEHGLVGKKLPYAQSVRIPFYARWPGELPRGRTDTRLIANVDVAPTILGVTGVAAAAAREMDGRSLLAPGTRKRTRVLIEHWRDQSAGAWPTWASLWTGRYQYVEYYGEDDEAVAFRELYDLRSDPWQTRNLVRDRDPSSDPPAALLKRLRDRLAKDRRCSGRACP
jgi:arylsulfatase A-like enzyme